MGFEGFGFVEVRLGLVVVEGGLEMVFAELSDSPSYVLDEEGIDVRESELDPREMIIFVGDHLGFDDVTREKLIAHGVTPIGVGPMSVHADDVITIVCNELDRRSVT